VQEEVSVNNPSSFVPFLSLFGDNDKERSPLEGEIRTDLLSHLSEIGE